MLDSDTNIYSIAAGFRSKNPYITLLDSELNRLYNTAEFRSKYIIYNTAGFRSKNIIYNTAGFRSK